MQQRFASFDKLRMRRIEDGPEQRLQKIFLMLSLSKHAHPTCSRGEHRRSYFFAPMPTRLLTKARL